MADKYNGEGYYSPTEYEAFTRIEKEEKAAAKAAAFRPIVYICSPYAGDTEKNTENARKYSRFAVDMHCVRYGRMLVFFSMPCWIRNCFAVIPRTMRLSISHSLLK